MLSKYHFLAERCRQGELAGRALHGVPDPQLK